MPRFLKTRRALVIAVILVVGAFSSWLMASGPAASDDPAVVARVRKGEFVVTVMNSGELKARESVQITAPANAQQAGAFQMRISSLVPEGTIVRAGDVVAEIDRSTLANRQTELTLGVTKAEAQLEQAQLDSTLNLGTAREAIRTQELAVEEKRLAKDQARFEPPTIQRQTEIDFERATRALAQARIDYQTKVEQAQARMREVGADVARQRNLLRIVNDVLAGFTIRAPSPGMVIYMKEWNGRKRTTGSQVSSWDPTVATLPDLSQMESVTYVNEIDIRRIAVNQPVAITLDSDPDKRLTGTVVAVANVGEQRPNQDAKVFEVKIRVLETDTTLRPGMTTGNQITTLRIPDALFVPLEALHGDDSTTYVYKQDGARVTRQEVVTGAMNDHEVVIIHGLEEGEQVLLTEPAEARRIPLVRLPEDQRPVADTTRAVSSAAAPRTRDTTQRRR